MLAQRNILAPIVVVKGDGTLMSAAMAKERPVETILSGPAASVAGARHLTGLRDALVVDMGGTTTDTAALVDGAVSVCETGSNVSGHKTHVKALEIRTVGLGGDSLIQYDRGEFCLGPRRVAPIAWLGTMYSGTEKALDFLKLHLDRYALSTRDMQILALTGSAEGLDLTPLEDKIVTLLKSRPHSIDELLKRTESLLEMSLNLERLEKSFIIQRCGLTLTDLLHVTGRFERWDKDASERFCQMVAHLAKMDIPQMAEHLLDMGGTRLTLELLKRQLDDEVDPDVLHTCPVCQTLVRNLLSDGSHPYDVRIDLKRPVVGIGAPIHFFLPRAAGALGTEAVLPENADVANAIGAITSNVVIKRRLRIIPDEEGGFLIDGLAGVRHFKKFEAADAFARDELVQRVRYLARIAVTSAMAVHLKIEDKIPKTADGKQIFLSRTIHANLSGRPDIVVKQNLHQKAAPAN